jgi:hypothetical protein
MDADGHEAAEGEICFYGGSERPAGLTAGTLAPQRFQSRCAAIDLDRLSNPYWVISSSLHSPLPNPLPAVIEEIRGNARA